jgi:hypothetical protein
MTKKTWYVTLLINDYRAFDMALLSPSDTLPEFHRIFGPMSREAAYYILAGGHWRTIRDAERGWKREKKKFDQYDWDAYRYAGPWFHS